MKKKSLKDMKKENRRLVLQSIIENENLSRIEISQISELSPSTVSSLVSELLEEQVLVESGELASTGGRKRTELTINANFAAIAVVDVKRNGAVLRIFDMQLNEQECKVLSDTYITGNDLLIAITAGIFEFEPKDSIHNGKLAGIGLMFQEDMTESEFNVMYSTSLSSASISLKDALFTQFHIPVLDEYSQSYTMVKPEFSKELSTSKNCAFVHVGKKVLASVMVNGRQLPLQGKKVIDITPLTTTQKSAWLLESGTEHAQSKQNLHSKSLLNSYAAAGEKLALLVQQITAAIKPICVFFSLDTIFLGGSISHIPGLTKAIHNSLDDQLRPMAVPKVEVAKETSEDMSNVLADKIRIRALCAK